MKILMLIFKKGHKKGFLFGEGFFEGKIFYHRIPQQRLRYAN
jgi:hypothetical protein